MRDPRKHPPFPATTTKKRESGEGLIVSFTDIQDSNSPVFLADPKPHRQVWKVVCVVVVVVAVLAAVAATITVIALSSDQSNKLLRSTGKLRMKVDDHFNNHMGDLHSPSSVRYIQNFCDNVKITVGDHLGDVNCSVSSLRSGSVIVDFQLTFQLTSTPTPSDLHALVLRGATEESTGLRFLLFGNLRVFADSILVLAVYPADTHSSAEGATQSPRHHVTGPTVPRDGTHSTRDVEAQETTKTETVSTHQQHTTSSNLHRFSYSHVVGTTSSTVKPLATEGSTMKPLATESGTMKPLATDSGTIKPLAPQLSTVNPQTTEPKPYSLKTLAMGSMTQTTTINKALTSPPETTKTSEISKDHQESTVKSPSAVLGLTQTPDNPNTLKMMAFTATTITSSQRRENPTSSATPRRTTTEQAKTVTTPVGVMTVHDVAGISTGAPTPSTKSSTLSTRAPIVSTKTPTLDTSGSALNTRAQTLSTRASTLSTRAPILSTKAPTLDTSESALNTRAQTLSTRSSTLSTRVPILSTKTPTLDTRESALNTRAQTSSTRASTSITRGPTSDTREPTLSSSEPASNTKAPTGVQTLRPSRETSTRTAVTSAPAHTTTPPYPGTNEHVEFDVEEKIQQFCAAAWGPNPVNESLSECPPKGYMYLPRPDTFPNHCDHYIVCDNGQNTPMSCAAGTHFVLGFPFTSQVACDHEHNPDTFCERMHTCINGTITSE